MSQDHDSLHERGRALENLFFMSKDAQLLEDMRNQMQRDSDKEALKSISGIRDDGVLEALVAAEIKPETIASVGIIPLVAVAWADNKMEANERDAILKAASENGIDQGSASFSMIESWLQAKPGSDLMEVWTQYIKSLGTVLDGPAFSQLKASVLERAKTVADSAGGFLGLGNKTSDAEQKVLDQLESAFQ